MNSRRPKSSALPEGTKRTPGRPREFDREVVLDRAMRLFWSRGYESTSVSDLTEAMGVTAPTLYSAFGDKKGLFLESVERYLTGPAAFVLNALTQEPTAERAMERLMRESVDFFTAADHPKGCMVVLAASNCSDASADVAHILAERRRAGERMIRERISAGLNAGELPHGTDVDALAGTIISTVYGLSIQARDGASRASLMKTVTQVMKAWPGRTSASSKRHRATTRRRVRSGLSDVG